MLKLTEAGDLEKASRSIGNFFAKRVQELEKSHGLHAALAAHHDAMKSEHTTQAAHYKATHDGMANDHELKHHFSKGHTHHTAMAAHHEAVSKAHAAHAESVKAEVDAMKTMAAEWGGTATTKTDGGTPIDVRALAGGTGNLDDRIKAVSDAMMVKALEALDKDPSIAERIQNIVLGQVEKAVGGKLVPTEVSAVTSDNPRHRAVLRPGQQPIVEKAVVPMEFEKLVDVEN